MKLSAWQRVKRRISLLGGSYTHPDGTIELDFEEKAGIDPTVDSSEVQKAMLDRYHQQQQRDRPRSLGAGLITIAVMLALNHAGFPDWLTLLIGALTGFGLHLLITGRWTN
jgi:hypothetical protein